jgi:hypothetical protein
MVSANSDNENNYVAISLADRCSANHIGLSEGWCEVKLVNDSISE